MIKIIKIWNFALLIGIIFLSFSCTAPINISTSGSEPRLVIFGAISEDTVRQYVTISKSVSFFVNESPPPISDAIVTISYDNITDTLLPDTLAGRYYIDSLRAEAGKKYILDVWLDFDQNGEQEHYQAESVMPHAPRLDSIILSNIVIQKMPIMYLYGKIYDDTENNFGIYTWKNSDTIGLFDYFLIMPKEMLVTTFDFYPMPYIVRGGFSKGDTLYLRVDNFNDEYAYFLDDVSSATSVSIPIFSSPPAEVYTNIKCLNANIKVSGFFAAYSRGKIFSVISKFDFKFGVNK